MISERGLDALRERVMTQVAFQVTFRVYRNQAAFKGEVASIIDEQDKHMLGVGHLDSAQRRALIDEVVDHATLTPVLKA